MPLARHASMYSGINSPRSCGRKLCKSSSPVIGRSTGPCSDGWSLSSTSQATLPLLFVVAFEPANPEIAIFDGITVVLELDGARRLVRHVFRIALVRAR